MEEWKKIPLFEEYEINEHGQVRSWKSKDGLEALEPKLLCGHLNRAGTRIYTLRMNGVQRGASVRTLLFEAGWVKAPPKRSGRNRPIHKLDAAGNIIATYPSVSAAAEANYTHCSNIRRYCSGQAKRLYCGLYTFRYTGCEQQ